jgi:hypothetical protein
MSSSRPKRMNVRMSCFMSLSANFNVLFAVSLVYLASFFMPLPCVFVDLITIMINESHDTLLCVCEGMKEFCELSVSMSECDIFVNNQVDRAIESMKEN